MKFILGRKIGMSRKFHEDGTVIPVTIVEAGPCTVVQVKTEKKDGYNAVQVGFGKKKNVIKPEIGHCKDLDMFRHLREFRVDNTENFKRGNQILADVFVEGDVIKVTGISIGKGFQGGVKRHGFHGSQATHGHKDQLRMPGSIGGSYPEHVLKGKRMAGQMGNQRATMSNLEIVSVDLEKNQLAIKGGIPGATNNLVLIYGNGDMVLKQPEIKEVNKKEVVENVEAKDVVKGPETVEAVVDKAEPIQNMDNENQNNTEEEKK